MTTPLKIFIFGSCVSRDFLELKHNENFELVDYFARSSFSSLSGKPIKDNRLIENIESKFQKRMVARDLSKNIFDEVKKNNYDLLLIDFIDERFNLARHNGSICTISTEFKKYQSKKYQTIAFDSNEKFELWKAGFNKFIDVLKGCNAIEKIRISRTYWASEIEGGDKFPDEMATYIKRNNDLLDRMYKHAATLININQFIDYPEENLIAAKEHKWGTQPFHYITSFYEYTKKSLEINFSKRNINTISTQSGKVFPDLLTAYKNIKDGEFFIHKNGVMYPFKWNMTAGNSAPIVFFTPGRTKRGKAMPVFQRSSYFKDLKEYNCISCFDPTLFKCEDMNLAWFQGEKNRFYVKELVKLWVEFLHHFRPQLCNLLYFGSSGGGILGFHLAKATPRSTLFISNIQTDIRKYNSQTLKKLAEISFDGDLTYIHQSGKNKNRFSINNDSGPFNLIFAQNKADQFHFEHHYKVWRSFSDKKNFDSVSFIEYHDIETGHGPLPKEVEVEIIKGIIEKRDIRNLFPNSSNWDEKKEISLKLGSFPVVKTDISLQWDINPFKSKSWCISYYGLSWLPAYIREDTFTELLESIHSNINIKPSEKIYKNFYREVTEKQISSITQTIEILNHDINTEINTTKKNKLLIEILRGLVFKRPQLNYESIKFGSRDKNQNPNIKKLITYLKDENILKKIDKQIKEKNQIKFPSIYNNGDATCSSSLYVKNRNSLIFIDNKYQIPFILVQDFTRTLPFIVIDLLTKKVYSNKENDVRAIKYAESIPLNNITMNKFKFGGYINSYARPYHYFLEKTPFFEFILSNDSSTKIATLKDSSFMLISEVYHDKKIHEKLINKKDEISKNGFYVDVFRCSNPDENEKAVDAFKKRCISTSFQQSKLTEEASYSSFKNEVDFTLWLGVCSEKREYLEQRELHDSIISHLNKKYNNRYLVIFDGITKTIEESNHKEPSKEEEYMMEISKKIKGKIIKGIGLTALEKIHLSQKIDIFICNALTDSIWTSWFSDKEGIAFAAKGSKILFPHKNTHIIDEKMVHNIGNSQNWSTTSFSIDPNHIYDVFIKKLSLQKNRVEG